MKTPNTSIASELRKDIAQLFNRTSNSNPKTRSETITEAMEIIEAHTAAAVKEAKINTLKELYVAIDSETASNEYVFNLQNAIEDKIGELTKDKGEE